MTDLTSSLIEQVHHNLSHKTPLSIHGAGSFDFLLGDYSAPQKIDMSAHQGIIEYHPSELFITVRAGTRISDIEQELINQGQRLATEVPQFSTEATIGGAVATGITGSSRPFNGAIRDHILGCQMINGKAELLNFGGQVMKNVAGYDVSRLMSGSFGTLGILLNITLKVIPAPERETTLVLDLELDAAVSTMHQLARQPLPLSGCVYFDSQLYVRLTGSEQGVIQAIDSIGRETLADAKSFWTSINQQSHDFFQSDKSLWRVLLPSNSPCLPVKSAPLIDWCGGLHWYQCESDEQIQTLAQQAGGYASRFGVGEPHYLHIENQQSRQLQQRIKQAFDASNCFNPALFAVMMG